jgi:hypothetical protein
MIYMAKCSVKCKYYQAYVTNDKKVRVVCAIRGYTIKNIKEKMPNIYFNCEKFVENTR